VTPATAAPAPSATTASRAVNGSSSSFANVTAAYEGVPPTARRAETQIGARARELGVDRALQGCYDTT
jgi:hypothetical protein